MKKHVKVSLLSFLILIFVATVGCGNVKKGAKEVKSTEKISNIDLSKYFTGYEGSFVLFDKNKSEYTIYNQAKSQKQVSPCSTFKIINSLIGLEAKVLKDENTTFKWDGTKYEIEAWNKDQTLKSAISNSVVWYFKEVASQVREKKMQDYINKYNYGNKDISGGLTKFWVSSSLKISPKEQVDMLRKFYDYKLPASKGNIDIVKNIITLSNENGIKLSGKTGSGGGGSIVNGKYTYGWFVGYVEKNNNVYFFATNIGVKDTIEKDAGGKSAKEITLKILKDKKIY
ncbi:class D beta-lactamase [Clostridium tagluense]|uniref:class D beta-lactamase n=1 Tax=Clostridium tagluense TaxID=360422 RepID=UPI001C0C16AC|nr:class D beta-lactamase [Clostridium tagluense]MBU3128968.1 class D beta-lactamase [Clostridium tagluense]